MIWVLFLRFPIGKGIAGHVAETGETLNVADVYMDERFNPGIDEQTGWYDYDDDGGGGGGDDDDGDGLAFIVTVMEINITGVFTYFQLFDNPLKIGVTIGHWSILYLW